MKNKKYYKSLPPEIRKPIKRNFKKEIYNKNKTFNKFLKEKSRSFTYFLTKCFIFHKTTEGRGYWDGIINDYDSISAFYNTQRILKKGRRSNTTCNKK